MKLQFFTIPALDSAQATIELNSFCTQHKISAIEKQFVNDGANSYWAISVIYIDSQDTLLNVSKVQGWGDERNPNKHKIRYHKCNIEEQI